MIVQFEQADDHFGHNGRADRTKSFTRLVVGRAFCPSDHFGFGQQIQPQRDAVGPEIGVNFPDLVEHHVDHVLRTVDGGGNLFASGQEKGVAAQQIARRQRFLAFGRIPIDERQLEQVRCQLRVELLRPFDVAVLAGEQQFMPVHDPLHIGNGIESAAQFPAEQLKRIFARAGLDFHRDHRMAEAIGRHGKFDRDVGDMAAVMAAAAAEDPLDHRPAADRREEVVHHRPLIVPGGLAARGFVQFVACRCLAEAEGPVIRPNRFRDMVVKADDRQLDLADHAVLVVARIADDRPAIGRAQKIVFVKLALRVAVVGTGEQLDPGERAGAARVVGIAVLIVEIGLRFGAEAIDAVEIEGRRADVGDFTGSVDHGVEGGRRVERDVVIDELAEKDHPDRHAVGPIIARPPIHRAALPADRFEYIGPRISGRKMAEHAPEAILAQGIAFVFMAVGTGTAKGVEPFQLFHSVVFVTRHRRIPSD